MKTLPRKKSVFAHLCKIAHIFRVFHITPSSTARSVPLFHFLCRCLHLGHRSPPMSCLGCRCSPQLLACSLPSGWAGRVCVPQGSVWPWEESGRQPTALGFISCSTCAKCPGFSELTHSALLFSQSPHRLSDWIAHVCPRILRLLSLPLEYSPFSTGIMCLPGWHVEHLGFSSLTPLHTQSGHMWLHVSFT